MIRDLNIHPVLNGFVVQVGCQTLVFKKLAHMTAEIERYYGNPEQVEKEYIATAVNKTKGEPAGIATLNRAYAGQTEQEESCCATERSF